MGCSSPEQMRLSHSGETSFRPACVMSAEVVSSGWGWRWRRSETRSGHRFMLLSWMCVSLSPPCFFFMFDSLSVHAAVITLSQTHRRRDVAVVDVVRSACRARHSSRTRCLRLSADRTGKHSTMPDSPADVKTQSRLTPPTMPPPPSTQGAPRNSSYTPTTREYTKFVLCCSVAARNDVTFQLITCVTSQEKQDGRLHCCR